MQCKNVGINISPVPAGGAGEVGSVVDWGDRLVHEWVGLDESQGFIREGGGRLVGSRWALTSAAARPVRQHRKKTQRCWIQFHGHRCKSTGSCLFLGTSRREKQVSAMTACVFLFFCSEMSVQNNNNSSCKNSIVRGRKTCSWKVTVCYLKMCLLPWFRDLLLWNRCPRWLTVPLLFEFATEGPLYVVHVESTDCWAGDTIEETIKEDHITKSESKGQEFSILSKPTKTLSVY